MNHQQLLIEKFYLGFKHSNIQDMIACYHDEIEFSDPVFPYLKGKQAKAMWAMLCQKTADPNNRNYSNIQSFEKQGSADWEVKYTLAQTGRNIHNKIQAQFVFQDDKIIKHTDHFSFWKWSIMAFGFVGFCIGWTPFFQKKIQTKLTQMLAEFIQSHPEYQ